MKIMKNGEEQAEKEKISPKVEKNNQIRQSIDMGESLNQLAQIS